MAMKAAKSLIVSVAAQTVMGLGVGNLFPAAPDATLSRVSLGCVLSSLVSSGVWTGILYFKTQNLR